MKRIAILLAVLALIAGCASQKPTETIVSKQNVEMTGNGFQVFRLGADLRLVPVQNPDNAAQWMIRATVPLMKLSEEPIGETDIEIVLLDESGMKVREDFVLVAEDLANLIPKYNAEKNLEKIIIFSASPESRKFFSDKEAVDMINRTKSVAMNVRMAQPEVVESVPARKVDPKIEKTDKPEPVTFKSLMSKYGVYGKLTQYDKALSNKEKKKAKEIEEELYQICKKVKADPTVPESVYKEFRKYIEDEEDRIEAKH